MKTGTQKSDHIVLGLLDYLSEMGDNNLLPEVSKELQKIVDSSKKAERVEVTSAVSFSDEQKLRLKKILKGILTIDLPLKFRIDKRVLAGFAIKIADWFLDATASYQLNQYKKRLYTE